MTVRGLRALARKHFGPSFNRLKSKSELVAALSEVLAASVDEAPEPEPSAGAMAARPPEPSASAPPPAPGRRPAAPGESIPTEPDPEGHLVARVAGERAAHASELPLVEEKVPPSGPREPPAYDERLGDLPDGYGEDSVVLLAKDPRSLYLYWDFSRETVERAFAWMPGLHTKVRLFADDALDREVDFSLEARSWYIHDLTPGRTYRAELTSHAIDGQVRRIGEASNPVKLPSEGPSPLVEDRFLRIPWEVPPPVFAEALRRSEPARAEAQVPAPAPLEPPPLAEEARAALYLRSGGASRAYSAEEIATLMEAIGPFPALPWAERPPEGQAQAAGPEGPGVRREPAPPTVGPLGPMPWSASIPPWSGTVPRR